MYARACLCCAILVNVEALRWADPRPRIPLKMAYFQKLILDWNRPEDRIRETYSHVFIYGPRVLHSWPLRR
jgi:hypothetical protein